MRHWAHSQPAVCAAPACRPCYTDLLSALKLALRMLAESCGCLLKVACCLLLCCSPSSSDPPLPRHQCRFGTVDDVVTFPGRMYAFVNYRATEEAVAAFAALQDTQVPELTGA